MNLFEYYGVDCIAFTLVAVYLYLVGQKNRIGWLVGAVACVFFIIFGVMAESIITILVNFAFGMMYVRNFYLWGDHVGTDSSG